MSPRKPAPAVPATKNVAARKPAAAQRAARAAKPKPSVDPKRRRVSLSPEQTDLGRAARNFRRLPRAEQLQLAHEAALTRGPELCLAYTNLLSVTSGFRTRRASPKGEKRLHREPCIGFVVSQKWDTEGQPNDPQALPKYLMVFADFDGKRQLCAIPTDVRAKADYGVPVPHADEVPYGILVDGGGAKDFSSGVAACVVRRPAMPSRKFVVSCRHVLSRTLVDTDVAQSGLPVILGRDKQTSLGSSTDVRGRLDDDSDYSFDAQLAEVTDSQALVRARGGVSFEAADAFLTRPGDVGNGFWIATGRTGDGGKRLLVWVDYLDAMPDFEMVYPLADGTSIKVVHRMVLHGHPEVPLMAGDSGSPAIRVQWGQRLIGMYIGGDDGNVYVIPAWQLVNPQNFKRPGESGWSLL